MADENLTPQNENAEGNARRTLKLRPTTTNPAGSQLADPMHGETDTSNLDVLDDTQTRKTIKIKPLSPAAPQINIGTLPPTPGATPLTGTQTRKSVVLKSQVPGATPLSGTQTRKSVVISPAAGATPLSGTQTRKSVVISPAAGATPLSGTQTRKSVVISPAAGTTPLSGTQTRKAVVISPAAGATPLSETQTRKTVILKPTAKPTISVAEPLDLSQAAAPAPAAAPATPAPAPAPAPAADLSNTETRSATVVPAADIEDSKTVKISRPKLNTAATPDLKRTVKLATVGDTAPAAPATPAAPAAPVAPAAPAAAKPAAPETIALKDEVQEVPKAEETAKAAASQPTTQLPATEALSSGAAIPEPPKNIKQTADFTITPAADAPKASVFYSVVAILTLVLVIAASAFAAAQYLDYDHKISIYDYIPGLPHANK